MLFILQTCASWADAELVVSYFSHVSNQITATYITLCYHESMQALRQSWSSIVYFLGLVFSGSLHTSKQHLHNSYEASNGRTYMVFCETVSDREYGGEEVTLIIGFRLKLIGKSRFFHWIFQHICILDTPIWVGFRGFKTKYWMVEPDTQDYLGLYRYQSKDNARKYAEYICAVFRPLSTRDSVWYEIIERPFAMYTRTHRVNVHKLTV